MVRTDNYWVSRCGKLSMLNNVFKCEHEEDGMEALRAKFPDGEADEFNFVLFSTSGISGSYLTIEAVESWRQKVGPHYGDGDGDDDDPDRADAVTFLVVHPRICCLMGGNCQPKTPDDFSFLKRLRQSSWEVVQKIGAAVV